MDQEMGIEIALLPGPVFKRAIDEASSSKSLREPEVRVLLGPELVGEPAGG